MTRQKNTIINLQNKINSLSEKRFVFGVTLAYFLLALVIILRHEVWLDEVQAWFIARDSTSLSNLFYNLRYEGHPPLWHLSLFFINRVTHNLAAMQILHIIISTISVYIVLRYSLFTRIQKILIVFGYYFLYEYAVVSRCYAYGVLFIFLFCTFFQPGIRKNYIVLAVILFFLSMTSAYGFLIVIALSGTLFFELIIDKELRNKYSDIKVQLFIAVFIILLGLSLSAIVMHPADDYGTTSGLTSIFNFRHIQKVARNIFQGLLPMPRLGRFSFWNTNIIRGRPLPSILGLLLIYFFLMTFSKKPVVCFLFSLTTFIFLIFQYFVYFGSLRHSGHYFVILIVCLWLSKYYQDDDRLRSYFNAKLVSFCVRNKIVVFNIILYINLIAGLYISAMDVFRSFTISPDIAKYIIDNKYDNLPVLGYDDWRVCLIGLHLNKPLYFPQGDRYGTFLVWDEKRKENINEQIIIERAKRISEEKGSDILLFLTQKLENDYDSIAALRKFHHDSILYEENYYLYVMKK